MYDDSHGDEKFYCSSAIQVAYLVRGLEPRVDYESVIPKMEKAVDITAAISELVKFSHSRAVIHEGRVSSDVLSEDARRESSRRAREESLASKPRVSTPRLRDTSDLDSDSTLRGSKSRLRDTSDLDSDSTPREPRVCLREKPDLRALRLEFATNKETELIEASIRSFKRGGTPARCRACEKGSHWEFQCYSLWHLLERRAKRKDVQVSFLHSRSSSNSDKEEISTYIDNGTNHSITPIRAHITNAQPVRGSIRFPDNSTVEVPTVGDWVVAQSGGKVCHGLESM